MTSHSFKFCTAIAALVLWAASAPAAFAHGLLISVRGDGPAVTGRIYYSDGEPGAGEWVQLFDLTQPKVASLSMASGADGSFRFRGTEGHRYRVTATGDEGHVVDSEITLAPGARGRFVESKIERLEPMGDGLTMPPAWAVLGGLLLLSMIPAIWFRRRSAAPVLK